MRSGSRPALALLGFALVLLVLSCSRSSEYPRPDAGAAGQGIGIRTEALTEGVPSFYSYEDGQRTINFFVLMTKGRVEAYLDACLKCAPRKLGYGFEAGRLRCRACGKTYGPGNLKGVGSCRPIPLEVSLSGDVVMISTEELLRGRRYF